MRQPYTGQVKVAHPPVRAEQRADLRCPHRGRCPELQALGQHIEGIRRGHGASGEGQENSELGFISSRLFGQFQQGTEERHPRVPSNSHVGA